VEGRADAAVGRTQSLLVLITADGQVERAEGAALRDFGLRKGDVDGRSFAAAWGKWPLLCGAVANALHGKLCHEFISVAGQPFRIECAPRTTAEGERGGALLFARAADRSESRLSEKGLERLVRNIPCAVWTTDRSLRITDAMGGPRHLGPVERQRVIGSTVQDFIASSDPADPMLRAYAEVLEGSSRTLLYRLDGAVYQVRLEPMRDDDGTIVGCAGASLDISALVASEQERMRSETCLEAAQEVAHVGTWEWDVATNQVRWSNELHHIYGIDKGQFDGTYEAFIDRVLPDDREYARSVIFDAYRKAQPFHYDHRIMRPDGSIRMLHTAGDVLVDAHGKVLRMAGACFDMTELWNTTRALEQSVSLLGATLESTADGILVTDRAGKVIAYNERLLELWGLTRENMKGRSFQALVDLTHPLLENGEACLRSVRDMEARPEAQSFDSLRFRDGRFFERYSRPQRIDDEIVGRVWSYRDVTERERLLRGAMFLADASRLLASLDIEPALEAMARVALSYFGDAIAIDLIADGNLRRLLVLSCDRARTISTELPPAARAGQPAIYSVGTTSHMTIPLRSCGELVGALTFAARNEQCFGDTDLATATALGRRVELALENARLYVNTREALAARDEFLSVAAHEIRGPLTSLRLAVEGLTHDPSAATSPRMLGIVDREGRRIAELADELLDVARIRGGHLRFVFAPVDLVEVTHGVLARLTPELSRSGSSMSIHAPPKVIGTWDRSRVDQVASNLISNAIKFGLGRPIEIDIAVEGAAATLSVRDHGIGIAPDAQRRIFAPFERAVSARHYGGLGLGLYIVQTIVAGLGGAVEVKSEPGAGSTFVVRLPIARAS